MRFEAILYTVDGFTMCVVGASDMFVYIYTVFHTTRHGRSYYWMKYFIGMLIIFQTIVL